MIPFLGAVIPFPYKILAVAVLALALFSTGYIKGHQSATQKADLQMAKFVKQADDEYKDLMKKKNKVDEKIVTEYVDKIVYVTKWRTKNVEVIKYVPDTGILSSGFVFVHDSSAKGRNADATSASNETPSGIAITEALSGIVENYATCHDTRNQLISLQDWITEQQKIYNKDAK